MPRFVMSEMEKAQLESFLFAIEEDNEDNGAWNALLDYLKEWCHSETTHCDYLRAADSTGERVAILHDVFCILAPDGMCRGQIEEMQTYGGYAEPGCKDPECGIVALGNWNPCDRYNPQTKQREDIWDGPKRFGDLLEGLGVELEWSDEWTSCNDCNKLVRTSPDSYSWEPAYECDGDSGILCHECCGSYEVITAFGSVYHGHNEQAARKAYDAYVRISQDESNPGHRGYREEVTLLHNGDIIDEHIPEDVTPEDDISEEDDNTCEDCGGEITPDCFGQPRCHDCNPCPGCSDGGGPQ